MNKPLKIQDANAILMERGTDGLRDAYDRSVAKDRRRKRSVRPDVGVPVWSDGATDAEKPELTEDEAASAFVAANRDLFRYCASRKRWLQWNGAVWTLDDKDATFQAIRAFCRDFVSDKSAKAQKEGRSTRFIAAVERQARTDPTIVTTADQWDADLWLLGTPEGTVNLRTGELRPGRASDLISKATAVAPSDQTTCPQWLRFLNEATGGDAERIAYLKRFCGYALTGDVREHSLLFAHGNGGNGKGVFMATIAGVMKSYAATAAMDTFMAGDKHPTDLAKLAGARLVTASENEEGKAWAEAKIKSMTGGDRIAARFMGKDFFEYQPQFKLFVIGNHQPVLNNVDKAMRRRLQIVPFTHEPKKKDDQLKEKLTAEWPAILRWMIEGCLDWRAGGLNPPESVMAATNEYFDDQDVFGDWLNEACDVEANNPHKTATSADLYASWTAYAKAAGEPNGSRKSFSGMLTKRGIRKARKGGTGGRLYEGVRLKVSGAAFQTD